MIHYISYYYDIQYIPRHMHTVFALLCFVVVIHWLIFPYPSGLLHWHCGNLTIAPVPAKQPWWIWINTSCEFIMNNCITTTKQSTTKPCAYFLGYTVYYLLWRVLYQYSKISENGIYCNTSHLMIHNLTVVLYPTDSPTVALLSLSLVFFKILLFQVSFLAFFFISICSPYFLLVGLLLQYVVRFQSAN